MWNRLLISLLLLLGNQALFSQTWLNKTDKDILLYISENKERIEDSKQTDTLFTLTCQEKDELGRLFEVSYRFNLEKNVCISYERLLPIHRYWAATFAGRGLLAGSRCLRRRNRRRRRNIEYSLYLRQLPDTGFIKKRPIILTLYATR